MTAIPTTAARTADIAPTRQRTLGQIVVRYATTTDHKLIGQLYFITAFIWFLFGGLLALVIRAELAYSGNQFV